MVFGAYFSDHYLYAGVAEEGAEVPGVDGGEEGGVDEACDCASRGGRGRSVRTRAEFVQV